MANLNFLLKAPYQSSEDRGKKNRKLKEKPCLLLVSYAIRRSPVIYSTGKNIYPKDWDFKKMRVKTSSLNQSKTYINKLLSDLVVNFEEFKSKCIGNNTEIDKDNLRAFLDFYFKGETNTVTLFTFIEDFINNAHTRTSSYTGKLLSASTIMKYKQAYRVLRQYAEKNGAVDFEHINSDFYDRFQSYMTVECGLKPNTIGVHTQRIKTLLKKASKLGLIKREQFEDFKILKEDVTHIYLTEQELKQIEDCDLSHSPKLANARDLFLLGAYTGQRFSDWKELKAQNIKADKLYISQQKTTGKVIIPMHPKVKEILTQSKPPHIITDQKANEYIKEVCRQAEITEPVTKTFIKGGKTISETTPKYTEVSTHTARRSFATNMYKKEMPVALIMSMTGHKTDKDFYKYIKLTAEEKADQIAKFFNQNQTTD